MKKLTKAMAIKLFREDWENKTKTGCDESSKHINKQDKLS